MTQKTDYQFEPPFYPIVYVRGYAMRREDIEETFYDSYYGFAASAVYKKQTQPEEGYLTPDLFEGQLIRFMKSRFQGGSGTYGYADAVNCTPGHFSNSNPSRSIWISRFYDVDYIKDKVRSIESHANDLMDLIIDKIPKQLISLGMDKGLLPKDYKVILIAHSMGGLVCRTLLQNILPNFEPRPADPQILDTEKIKRPEELIHKFVTIGTPHRGIDMGNIPDIIENAIVSAINPYDSNIFKPRRMRSYLKLGDLKSASGVPENPTEEDFKFDIHSLGNSTFPIDKCLCVIGSDYSNYSGVKYATGSFSDGLVKQDRAYIVSGEKPESNSQYPERNVAYYANVHRAHSGYRGIINSYETYENIQRFLFGDLRVRIALNNINIRTPVVEDYEYFYDVEFSFTIQGTGVYLHQRKQDLCENAVRFKRNEIGVKEVFLHNAFLNSKLCQSKEAGSHFIMKFSILEYRTKQGCLWDTQYPSRTIYSESLEVRVRYDENAAFKYIAQYSWQSDTDDWQDFKFDGEGNFVINLTPNSFADKANVTGNIILKALGWD